MYLSVLLLSNTVLSQHEIYIPRSYEQILSQAITALEAKKKLLDQKISAVRKSDEKTNKDLHLATSDERVVQLKAIRDANQAVLTALQGSSADISPRIKKLSDEKSRIIKQGIRGPKEERLLIAKTNLQLSIDDITERIADSTRAEALLDKQLPQKKGTELTALLTEKRQWEGKRAQLIAKRDQELDRLKKLK